MSIVQDLPNERCESSRINLDHGRCGLSERFSEFDGCVPALDGLKRGENLWQRLTEWAGFCWLAVGDLDEVPTEMALD